jgi:hypothetical protein
MGGPAAWWLLNRNLQTRSAESEDRPHPVDPGLSEYEDELMDQWFGGGIKAKRKQDEQARRRRGAE